MNTDRLRELRNHLTTVDPLNFTMTAWLVREPGQPPCGCIAGHTALLVDPLTPSDTRAKTEFCNMLAKVIEKGAEVGVDVTGMRNTLQGVHENLLEAPKTGAEALQHPFRPPPPTLTPFRPPVGPLREF